MGLEGTMLKVEPGLIEWPGWYKDGKIPQWMSATEIAEHGISVDPNYTSQYLSTVEIDLNETVGEYYERTHRVVMRCLEDAAGTRNNYRKRH